jgi:endo-1,4-beta-xylanase
MLRITRRDSFALGFGAASLASGLGLASCGLIEGPPSPGAPLSEPSLKTRAAAKGLLFGAALMADHLDKDPAQAEAFIRECGLLVSQNELKWAIIRPAPGQFDFTRPDRLAAFAQAHGVALRGHTLIWYISNPAWLDATLAPANAEKLMGEHIWSVAGRYRGKMQSWDVVNEAVEIDDGRPDGLRKTPWLATMGPEHIQTAFHIAHEADPHARLCYNDYGLEYGDEASEAKRRAVLALLERLRAAKAPVHVMGIQAHLRGGRRFDPKPLMSFIDEVAGLGLEVYLTEFDVNDVDLPRRIASRDAAVAMTARQFLDPVLDHRAVKLVASWGLSDKYTYRNEPEFKHFCWDSRPLPLDEKMRRKPLWQAMAQAFDNAPVRSPALKSQAAS